MENTEFEPIEPKKRNPLYGFIALFLAIALFFLSIEGYLYLIHPEPVDVPALSSVQQFLPADSGTPFSSYSSEDLKKVIVDTSDTTKQVANYVASQSCKKADQVCQSKALFNFVRDNIEYVSDPNFHDRLENPLTVLKTGGADCEDMAVLLLALEKSIGNETRLVFIPGHAFAQIRVPNYKGDKWLNLEPTCKTCQFNELPDDSALAKKNYVEL